MDLAPAVPALSAVGLLACWRKPSRADAGADINENVGPDPLPTRLSSRTSLSASMGAGGQPLCLEVHGIPAASSSKKLLGVVSADGTDGTRTTICTRDEDAGFGPSRPLVLWTKEQASSDVSDREWTLSHAADTSPEPALTLSRVCGASESNVSITEGDTVQEHVTELAAIEPFSLERRLQHGSLTYFWTPVDIATSQPRFVLTQALEGHSRGAPGSQQPTLAEFYPAQKKRQQGQVWVYRATLGNLPIPLVVITALWLDHLRRQQGKSRRAKVAAGPL